MLDSPPRKSKWLGNVLGWSEKFTTAVQQQGECGSANASHSQKPMDARSHPCKDPNQRPCIKIWGPILRNENTHNHESSLQGKVAGVKKARRDYGYGKLYHESSRSRGSRKLFPDASSMPSECGLRAIVRMAMATEATPKIPC